MTRKINTAYEAFWFLTEHPKFKCREARMLTPREARAIKLSKGQRLRRVKDSLPWVKKTYMLLEYGSGLEREAMTGNLNIHYAKTDGRRINDDHIKNIHTECWLEFGEMKQTVSDGCLHVAHFHDPRLDCGAPTFDEAIVKLARLVRKHYGDFKRPKWIAEKNKAA
jgi:hypothetical protein